MGELNAGDRALPVDEARDALERLEMLVAPDAEVLRRDPPLRRDRRRFGEHQRRAADRARREMGEMPVVGVAVDAGILAHRRNADAIGERDVAQAKRAEQVRHGGAIRVWGSVGLIVRPPRSAPQGVGARRKNRDILACPLTAILLGNARVRPLGRDA